MNMMQGKLSKYHLYPEYKSRSMMDKPDLEDLWPIRYGVDIKIKGLLNYYI